MSDDSLPQDWEMRPLGDCVEKLKSGKRVERGWSPQCLNHPTQSDEEWGVLKTTAVQMGEYQPEHHKALPSNLEPKRGLEVGDGDFLLTTTGPRSRCGVVCLARNTPKKLIFSGKILRFRADEKKVSASWLESLMMSPVIQSTFDSLKVGTSDSSVSIGNRQVLDLQIPVPPREEQERIVEILEEQLSRLDAAVKSVQTVREKAAQFRRSLLYAAFIGKLTDGAFSAERSSSSALRTSGFDELFEVVSNRRRQVKRREYLDSGKFPVVDQGESLVGGYVNDESLLFSEGLPIIVFGDHTRRFKYLDFPFVVGADGTKLIRCRSGVFERFAYYQLEATEFRNRGYARHLGELRKELFWIPSLDEQRMIVLVLEEQLSRLDATLAVADEVERKNNALRRSLLHAAFTGELTRFWRESHV